MSKKKPLSQHHSRKERIECNGGYRQRDVALSHNDVATQVVIASLFTLFSVRELDDHSPGTVDVDTEGRKGAPGITDTWHH